MTGLDTKARDSCYANRIYTKQMNVLQGFGATPECPSRLVVRLATNKISSRLDILTDRAMECNLISEERSYKQSVSIGYRHLA